MSKDNAKKRTREEKKKLVIRIIAIFLAVLMVIATLLSDLVYKVVDPRISFD